MSKQLKFALAERPARVGEAIIALQKRFRDQRSLDIEN